jgi:biopolymer transport protein TolR
MAMSVGENKGRAMAELNVVPLIDILLVLLIIFMVISPLMPIGLDAAVPQPSSDIVSPPGTVVVQVARNGKLKINNEETDFDRLGSRMDQIFKDRAEKVAFVKGDDDVLFMDIARTIDIMRGSGIDKVGLIPEEIKGRKENTSIVGS